MELWDVYDAKRRPLHRTHVRGVPMAKGEYHLVVFVWVFNSRGELLLTKRAPEKKHYPNLWECTGGAAQAGETSLQAIRRELFEETGIRAEEEEFRLMGSFCEWSAFCDIYALRRDAALTDLVMQPGETCDARWETLERLEEMIAAGQIAQPDVRRFRQLEEKFRALLRQWR